MGQSLSPSERVRRLLDAVPAAAFAAHRPDLWADAIRAAVAEERETCAKLVEDLCAYTGGHGEPGQPGGGDLARAIRARGSA